MIYVDSSVACAEILSESRAPGDAFWSQPLVSSRLLVYEVWNRVQRHGAVSVAASTVEEVLARIQIVNLDPEVLERAVIAFPVPVRTLDALHLATADFLRAQGVELEVASYDTRLNAAASRMGFALAAL